MCAKVPVRRALDSTGYKNSISCPRRYDYEMNQGYRRRSDALEFGTWYHSGTAVIDQARVEGVSKDEAARRALRHILDGPPALSGLENRRTLYTLARTLVWYTDWGYDDNVVPVEFEPGIAATELSFRLPLPFNTPDGDPYLLCGHLDGVVTFGSGLWVRERKTTTSTLGGYYWNRFSPDPQVSIYHLAARLLFPDLKFRGVLIEACQTGVTFCRYGRHPVSRTRAQAEEFLRDLERWTRINEDFAREDYWPMNTSACQMYGGCIFRSVCSADPGQRARILDADFIKQFWNPLEER
jgi:hypothetical protein